MGQRVGKVSEVFVCMCVTRMRRGTRNTETGHSLLNTRNWTAPPASASRLRLVRVVDGHTTTTNNNNNNNNNKRTSFAGATETAIVRQRQCACVSK